MKKCACILGQFFILCGVYYMSQWVTQTFTLPVPANILGVLVLFFLLCIGIIKETYIKDVAHFFLQHLMFFFVPITVGLMNFGEVFEKYGWVLIFSICVSSLIPLLVVGLMAQSQQNKKNQDNK